MLSNCLFEAVKAKLKDWHNIKIIVLPKRMNNRLLHFLWLNKKDNTVCHFSSLKNDANNLLFKGKYKTLDFAAFEAWIIDYNKENISLLVKYAKQVGLKIINMNGIFDYEVYYQDIEDVSIWSNNFPSLQEVEYLKKVLRLDDIQIKVIINGKLYLMSLSEVESLKGKQEFKWKHITVFDSDFTNNEISYLT